MTSELDLVRDLTDQNTPPRARRHLIGEFAKRFGWRPNDFVETSSYLATASLVVEQGLDNAVVLSFLPSDRRLQDIQTDELRSVLGLSYNSLIDWHVWIDRESIQYFYNRTDPPSPTSSHRYGSGDYSALTKKVFDQATGLAPNPNVPTLDGVLLETIAHWRRILRSELGAVATNASISALFNAIIFARAIEDFHAKDSREDEDTLLLRDLVGNPTLSITGAIEKLIVDLTGSPASTKLFDRSALAIFDSLSRGQRRELVNSFYGHPSVPYAYDFSVISKHALSKIYERYVAVMQYDQPFQFSMFPSEPDEEEWNKRLGGIYTPQYIASFFARYYRKQLSPERFVESSVLDPACGSGMFLRATMEQKILAVDDVPSGKVVETALSSMQGVDIDENAVSASRLSLALLYLAGRGKLPMDVPIVHDDSLQRFSPGSPSSMEVFDAVMMNPPFIRTELQPEATRQAIVKHVGITAKGKLDTYVAFLRLAIRAIRPGGFGFFVVPQPLLTSDSLKKLRDWILDQAWVRVIADLSAIPVFKADAYVILLIVQRKDEIALSEPTVSLIKCQRDVGGALEDFLDGRWRKTYSYSIFDVPQTSLNRETWSPNTPRETQLLSKLGTLPQLKDVAKVRQGMITGRDDVFIIDKADVPRGEESLYQPLLPDRMIGRFYLPEETGRMVFYPFIDGRAADAAQVEADFPATWGRLNEHRSKLESRADLRGGGREWWRPAWPRPPHEMLAPKIVVPQLFLVPRFGLDVSGQWVVNHSPFMYIPGDGAQEDLLFVLTALLNSSVSAWFIDLNARKYRSQYNMVSVALLRRFPIPVLRMIPQTTLRRVIDLVSGWVSGSVEFDREQALLLDDLVLRRMYSLSDEEVNLITQAGG